MRTDQPFSVGDRVRVWESTEERDAGLPWTEAKIVEIDREARMVRVELVEGGCDGESEWYDMNILTP